MPLLSEKQASDLENLMTWQSTHFFFKRQLTSFKGNKSWKNIRCVKSISLFMPFPPILMFPSWIMHFQLPLLTYVGPCGMFPRTSMWLQIIKNEHTHCSFTKVWDAQFQMLHVRNVSSIWKIAAAIKNIYSYNSCSREN